MSLVRLPHHSLPSSNLVLCDEGYLFRSLLGADELSCLRKYLEREEGVLQHSYTRDDGHGRQSRMCLWNHPGEDLTGMVGRCQKVAGTMQQLLKGEVYHYHTKLMMKEAHTGGSFVWHQDYGLVPKILAVCLFHLSLHRYWYNNGCLFPDMGTVFIAIDKCSKENGCLKVYPSKLSETE